MEGTPERPILSTIPYHWNDDNVEELEEELDIETTESPMLPSLSKLPVNNHVIT